MKSQSMASRSTLAPAAVAAASSSGCLLSPTLLQAAPSAPVMGSDMLALLLHWLAASSCVGSKLLLLLWSLPLGVLRMLLVETVLAADAVSSCSGDGGCSAWRSCCCSVCCPSVCCCSCSALTSSGHNKCTTCSLRALPASGCSNWLKLARLSANSCCAAGICRPL